MEKSVTEKIRELADKTLREKIEAETKVVNDAAERDRQVIETCLEMIEKNLVYKDIEQIGWGHKYVLATADMFYEDYVKEPKNSWNRGIKLTEYKRGDDGYLYYGVFTVNGERYYDMRYLLRKYEKDVANTVKKLDAERDKLREIYDSYEEAVRSWPEVKKLVADWNRLNDGEEDL